MKEQGKTQWGNLQQLPPWQEFLKPDRSEHIIKLSYKSGVIVYTMAVLTLPAVLQPVREENELRQSAFRRRYLVHYGSHIGKVYIRSPEDLFLYKLIYFGSNHQTKHSRDITAILKPKKNVPLLYEKQKYPQRRIAC